MPARRGRFRRPLLGVARATLREACTAQGLEPWDDPHNTDPAYARVRVRHQAMPALEEAIGPGVAAALARSAAQLSQDCDALDALAAAESWRIVLARGDDPPEPPDRRSAPRPADPSLAGLGQRGAAAGGDGTGHAGESRPAGSADGAGTGQAVVVLDMEGLAELAPAVRSRVLRQAALAAGCPGGSLAAGHVAALDALVTGWHGQRWADLPGVIRARRRYGKLLFSNGRPAGAGQPEPTEAEATFGRE
jgi:tRNA(Ile)-lysidine synthase